MQEVDGFVAGDGDDRSVHKNAGSPPNAVSGEIDADPTSTGCQHGK
jgi:hypothetical protein